MLALSPSLHLAHPHHPAVERRSGQMKSAFTFQNHALSIERQVKGVLGGARLGHLRSITAISINLARGRTPHCRCFGQLHSTPVSWMTSSVMLRSLSLPACSSGMGETKPPSARTMIRTNANRRRRWESW